MSQKTVLVVDDDVNILFAFKKVFDKEGFRSLEAKDGKQALEKIAAEKPDLIFMDITMPQLDGLEALQKIKEMHLSIPVIIITGHGTMHTAIKAMQYGAFDYLTKPLSVAKIRKVAERALESTRDMLEESSRFQAETMDRYDLVGNSPPMQELYKLIGTVSTTPNQTSVLIVGETGTGKELVARTIHSYSSSSDAPFIAINCTAFPETLLESELFGYERGAFTGASERKLGKFEISGKGTIFLDEIGDLPKNLQSKLLRVLQEREFERLGGHESIQINARFIAATNQNIAEKVKSGTFREDFYFRLNSVSIYLPPLRERNEDIPLLATYFLEKYNSKLKKEIKGFSEDTLSLLRTYSYPGNIRELENLVERAVMVTKGEVILPDAIGELITPQIPGSAPLPIISPVFSKARQFILNIFEKQFLRQQLDKHNGNVSAAAKSSQMTRQNFHRLVMKHGIQPPRRK